MVHVYSFENCFYFDAEKNKIIVSDLTKYADVPCDINLTSLAVNVISPGHENV